MIKIKLSFTLNYIRNINNFTTQINKKICIASSFETHLIKSVRTNPLLKIDKIGT